MQKSARIRKPETNKRTGHRRTLQRRSPFDEIPGFMYIADLSAAGLRPLNVVGGFTSLTGYPAAYFLKPGFYDSQVVDKDDLKHVVSAREKSRNGLGSAEMTYHLRNRAGSPIFVKERIVALSGQKESRLVGGFVTVASEQNLSATSADGDSDVLRLQEIQRMNDHLLEVNQLKDEFLANTSHELRTPLNSIIGFLTLLTEGYYESEDEMRQFTRNALESSRHLLSVINDILDISKIEAGTMDTHIEKVSVDSLMDEIRSLFELQAGQKGLVLECAVKNPPLYAAADSQKLKQVLINLVGNSIKFTHKGKVQAAAATHNHHIVFTVKDTGIGIPTDKLDKVFQKFIQVDGSATRRYGGTGLGLAISKHLVEMMGGTISVTSKGVGTGTRVRLTVPCWEEEEA